MTTVDLKNRLIHTIAGLNDKSLLTAIEKFIETKSESMIYKTSQEQRRRIAEGRSQIEKGETFTNEQVELEMDKWLYEK
jgi:predicted transcriptional regulator